MVKEEVSPPNFSLGLWRSLHSYGNAFGGSQRQSFPAGVFKICSKERQTCLSRSPNPKVF